MTADEFLSNHEYGRKPIRDIADVVKQWDHDRSRKSCDDATGMATMFTVLGIDAITGDGLLNEISPELVMSMSHLMGDKADTYDEARQLIADKLAHGNASFAGFVSKIKGQIGEDRFIQEYPDYALAISKSQVAVDAFKPLGDGVVEAVQIKMYADPNAVVKHMLSVQAKVDHGLSVQGDIVGQLNFAVPENIADEVRMLAAKHSELSNIHILTVKSSAFDVADVVRDAGNNIAHPLQHLGEDIISSVAFMAALDALTNAYLVAKGKKSIGAVVQEAVLKTPIGAVAITASKTTAMLMVKTGAAVNPIAIPVLTAIATRKLAQNWYDNRFKFAGRLKTEMEWISLLSIALLNRDRHLTASHALTG
jgi:hypothetical protein